MAKTVADVMNMVKENEVKFVDFRFTGTRGKQHHTTVPVSHFDESKFTDGHAFEAITSFHQSSADLANLAWADIYADQWKPTLENPNLQRHKQAEFLVHQFVPVNALVGIAVYNSHIRTQVEQMVQQAGLTLPVREWPAWYY